MLIWNFATGQDKLGQPSTDVASRALSKDLVSRWAPERARESQSKQSEPEWQWQSEPEIEPKWVSESQSEHYWARVSQGEPERSWLTSSLLTDHHAQQWEGDWPKKRNIERETGSQKEFFCREVFWAMPARMHFFLRGTSLIYSTLCRKNIAYPTLLCN